MADHGFALVHNGERLELVASETRSALSPLAVDFDSPTLRRRRKTFSPKHELIVRACGIKRSQTTRVLDVTAGLGTDAFILACAGCEVLMLERSPVISALVADGLERARTHSELALQQIAQRMTLVATDAETWMQQWLQQQIAQPESDRPMFDVVYCDPMFPDSQKTAQVKKNAQWLRLLTELGTETDTRESDTVLMLGLAVAKKRVVVKRPRTAPTLGSRTPDWVIAGSSNRFDVYDAGRDRT